MGRNRHGLQMERAIQAPLLRALRRGQQTDPWGSGGKGAQKGQSASKGHQPEQAPKGHQSGKGQQQGPGHAEQPRRGTPQDRGRIAMATTLWPFCHDARGEELDQDPIEQFTETEAESEDPIELFTDDGLVGDASSSSSSMASGSQQPHHGGEQRFGLEEMEMRKERPWDMPTFQDFPYLKASDQWTSALPGWLIRIHGKKRTPLFHPLHQMNEMEINRATVIFLEDGAKIIKHDQWAFAQQGPEEAKGKQWRGFTFFKLKAMGTGLHAGIPEGDEHGDEVENTGEIQLGSSSKGRDPLRPERKATESRTASLLEKPLVLHLNNHQKVKREKTSKEPSPQKPIRRIRPQRDLVVGVMNMMMFVKVMWFLVMKLKMMMGVLNWFMKQFPLSMVSSLCHVRNMDQVNRHFAPCVCAWRRWRRPTRASQRTWALTSLSRP